ncbi:MAG TPA: arsenate reductase ArsC [Chthoniobacterales bacterium]|jgi:arsenate reductase (thioredoxin)|nr:arsenate reductase ArsC [Chthoniobacterales bacterium]
MSIRRPFKILFLCTGNSARSVFGEYLIRKLGQGRFESYSAGADPRPQLNPYTVRVLQESFKIDASGARPKSWDEYKEVVFDFVVTVCDNAKETCPVWPGQPITAHWSSPDPAEFKGSDEETYRYFWTIAQQIYRRVDLLCNLPFEKLDRLRLEHATRQIGEQEKDL